MKRLLLGAILYFTGFVGYLTLAICSIEHPVAINNIEGIYGFLIKYRLTGVYVSFIVLCITGIIIMAIETFFPTLLNSLSRNKSD